MIGLLLSGVLLVLINSRQGETIHLEIQTPKAYIEVNVAGSVASPGVYRLLPGQRIYHAIEIAGGASQTADLTRLNLAAILEDGQRIYVPNQLPDQISSVPPLSSGEPINLNNASLEELMSLPGIGKVKARAIIVYRDNNGIFGSLDDLLKVDGINKSLFDEIKSLLVLEP